MEDQKFEVEHLASDKIIGYKLGHEGGGLVYDASGNVVGRLLRGVGNEWILDASLSHHTGKRYQGDSVLWANRPSRKF